MRDYLFITYTVDGKQRDQHFLLKEASLIVKIIKEQADNGICSVSLETTTKERFEQIFG